MAALVNLPDEALYAALFVKTGRKTTVPSTRLTSYRCSLPGLAGFASVPSPGTAFLFP